jgi:hypothetical protein
LPRWRLRLIDHQDRNGALGRLKFQPKLAQSIKDRRPVPGAARNLGEQAPLRPLAPLGLKDRQHVTITVDEVAPGEVPPAAFNPRHAEMQWIGKNAARYIGQWLALDGERLISHGATLNEVDAEARARGVEEPLFYHVPQDWGQLSAGGLWL